MPVTTLRRLSVGCAFIAGDCLPRPRRGTKSTPPGPFDSLLLTEKRNRLVIRRSRDRLQIGVDVGQFLIGENLLGEGRHVAARRAHEAREGRVRQRNGRRDARTFAAALTLVAVALPTADTLEIGFALGGVALWRGSAETGSTAEHCCTQQRNAGQQS